MRRYTSHEKFLKLVLRDDGSMLAESTRRCIFGLPQDERAFVVQVHQDRAGPSYCRLVYPLVEGWSWGIWENHNSAVWYVADAPIQQSPTYVQYPPQQERHFVCPQSWPAPHMTGCFYLLRPSATPHVMYYQFGQHAVQRLDLRTGQSEPTNDIPRLWFEDWRYFQMLADGTGLIYLPPGLQMCWCYEYQTRVRRPISFRKKRGLGDALAIGWERLLFRSPLGEVCVRTYDDREVCCIQPGTTQRFLHVVAVPGLERVLTANSDHSVTLWDVNNRRPLQTWDWGVGKPLALAVAPNGLMAAVAGNNHQVVQFDLDD